jgi:hypothetical protein
MNTLWRNQTNNNIKPKRVNIKSEYVIVDYPTEGKTFGKFIGTSPKRAASKAFSKLAKVSQLNNSKRQLLVFTMRNQTTGKEYKYIGSRVKLMKPKKVSIGGKEVVYRYKNIVGKYRDELNKIQE